jgi:hypothetical protein
MTRSDQQETSLAESTWADEDLVQKTQDVWSKVYGREVTRLEALGMLSTVRWLAKTLKAEVVRRSRE